MKLLTLAPLRISVPVYCAIWYAGSGDADFSIHLYGSTGCFKTEYAALATQHFGAGLDARNLPANGHQHPTTFGRCQPMPGTLSCQLMTSFQLAPNMTSRSQIGLRRTSFDHKAIPQVGAGAIEMEPLRKRNNRSA